ncbi:MAG: tyrosine-type recombinase/integrase [Pirellulaceae bacterium]
MPKRQKGAKLMKGRPITGEEFDRLLSKVEAGIIAEATTKPKTKTLRKRTYSVDARKRLQERMAKRAAAEAPEYRRMLNGLWWSGLRLGEALNLSWYDEALITVDLEGQGGTMRIPAKMQKSRKDGIEPITPEFVRFLLTTPKDERTGLVFKLIGNREMAHASKVISAIGKAAGVVVDKESGNFASAHDLRRSFGFRWAQRVMPAVLKQLMRHADIATTMKFYVQQEAAETYAELWRKYGTATDAAGVNTFVNTSQFSGDTANCEKSQTVDSNKVIK